MIYMSKLDGQCYNYRNKGQILYNKEFLCYICIIRNNLFIHVSYNIRGFQISFIYYILFSQCK